MVCTGNGRPAPPSPLATDPPQRALRDRVRGLIFRSMPHQPVVECRHRAGRTTHPTQVPQAGHGDPQEVDTVSDHCR